ncbi:tRNA (guanosine(46)-N7)-methyltransferase TrmB [Micropruina sonneratiae]|uniref:tRNA (guanosine(46)-N7)-methyltransferase TrmB n=1 Tax=Micropruina sonneratiae TaxID=2986940 RepID=UPI002227858A|nr:tRNA (guanosine(46)-N7)-methyltransferase TrmB [Micropruina sp. KQZ13P-5]MCW3156911.1 tRNA (guanosine(46)-N7)-methyltransferase TrmB [Micropruina sp. KQZ13P-5]
MGDARPVVQREVVSFVRRSARMNPSQEKAWRDHADWVLRVPTGQRSTSVAPDAHLDWADAFGRRAPLVVEVGGGTGDVIAAVAALHPERNHVAFEVFEPAVASTLSKCARAGVDNVRVVVANGVEGLTTLIPDAALAELWTFFPDPWPKKRHHKRRLVSPAFAALAARKLAADGVWRLATDDPGYAEAIRAVLDAEPALVNRFDGWAPRWQDRPHSRYEAKGIAAGRAIRDLCYGIREGVRQ